MTLFSATIAAGRGVIYPAWILSNVKHGNTIWKLCCDSMRQ